VASADRRFGSHTHLYWFPQPGRGRQAGRRVCENEDVCLAENLTDDKGNRMRWGWNPGATGRTGGSCVDRGQPDQNEVERVSIGLLANTKRTISKHNQ